MKPPLRLKSLLLGVFDIVVKPIDSDLDEEFADTPRRPRAAGDWKPLDVGQDRGGVPQRSRGIVQAGEGGGRRPRGPAAGVSPPVPEELEW